MSKLPENLKNLRLMRGLSQKQLGEKLNKSPNAISNWEKGMTSPDVDLLETICKVLKVTPNQLYGWDRCKELDDFLAQEAEILSEIDKLTKKRLEIDKKLQEYSVKLSRKR
ncbi:MAG: helix-turn-helix domain-containing protein [Bacteroidota bacterium]|nr:helix-turn-helix domain-containing protein [Bacteroidota bacterium]